MSDDFRVREHFPDMPALLAEVRRRPGMWMGRKSIWALSDMLAGISYAENFHEVPAEKRIGGFDSDAFEKWVDLTYQSGSCGSFRTAERIAGSDEAGFELWFKWYDEFRALTQTGR